MDFKSIILFVLIVVFIYLLLDFFLPNRKKKIEDRLYEVKLLHASEEEKIKEKSLFERIFITLQLIALKYFGRHFRKISNSSIEMKLQRAGRDEMVYQFYAKRIVLAAVLGVIVSIATFDLLYISLAAAVGFYLPLRRLNEEIENRKKQIKEEIPSFFDMLAVVTPASDNFEQALDSIVGKLDGVFTEEFRIYLDEVNLGKSRKDALFSLAERCDVDEVHSLARQVINTQKLGTGLADTLEGQAEKSRGLKKEMAEEKAHKASTTLLLPTVFLLLSLIIFLLGPTLIDIFRAFTSF